jgi:spectinomycin phosphotransferase
MRARPDDLDEERLRRELGTWGVHAAELTYAAVGFGDHHWIAVDGADRRWFVTAADLKIKGIDLPGLEAAMDTAAALDLDFVVAPLRAADGRTVHPIDSRYAVSVFPFLDAVPGDFERPDHVGERRAVLEMLATLHRQRPPAPAPVLDLGLPTRGFLDDVLDDAVRWARGPFAGPARALIREHSSAVRRRLEEFDRLVAGCSGRERVLTHGEPHPDNLLRCGDRHVLIDWDTVGLAPPERDLWDVVQGPADLEHYAEVAGREADASALALYRIRWDLGEVAEFADWFRAPHDRSPDTEEGWQALVESVEKRSGGAPSEPGRRRAGFSSAFPDRVFAFDEFGPLAIRPRPGTGRAPKGHPAPQPGELSQAAWVRARPHPQRTPTTLWAEFPETL